MKNLTPDKSKRRPGATPPSKITPFKISKPVNYRPQGR